MEKSGRCQIEAIMTTHQQIWHIALFQVQGTRKMHHNELIPRVTSDQPSL